MDFPSLCALVIASFPMYLIFSFSFLFPTQSADQMGQTDRRAVCVCVHTYMGFGLTICCQLDFHLTDTGNLTSFSLIFFPKSTLHRLPNTLPAHRLLTAVKIKSDFY